MFFSDQVFYGIIIVFNNTVLTSSCKVYPSEYSYNKNSFERIESTGANCREYPSDTFFPASLQREDFLRCDGMHGQLSDSNFGQIAFNVIYYYVWSGAEGQLLFIFPTRVSLTTITLHYYSDSTSVRGLPRLIFYAVPDDFDTWDAPTTSYPRVDVASVPPGGVPAGRRSISINATFNTMKVLMYKYSSNFKLTVSEVEFFTCGEKKVY